MPHHENATPHARTAGDKGHPLREPLGKIIHTLQDGSVDFFEIGMLGMKCCISFPDLSSFPVVQCLVEDPMGWRKQLHCFKSFYLSKP